jgi:hypothetical protein
MYTYYNEQVCLGQMLERIIMQLPSQPFDPTIIDAANTLPWIAVAVIIAAGGLFTVAYVMRHLKLKSQPDG